MSQHKGESWRFQVVCPHADGVFLVKLQDNADKAWLPMKPSAKDVWSLDLALAPGRYRMLYYLQQGQTIILGGTSGLSANRLSGAHPQVYIEPLESSSPS